MGAGTPFVLRPQPLDDAGLGGALDVQGSDRAARERGPAMLREPALYATLGPIWIAGAASDRVAGDLGPQIGVLQDSPVRVDMRGAFSPPRDQASRPLCEIMAVCAALDHLAGGHPALATSTHSPQFLWWNYQRVVASQLTPGLAWGQLGTEAAHLALLLAPTSYDSPSLSIPGQQGVVSEMLVPYDPDEPANDPTDAPLPLARAHLGEVADRIAASEALPADGARARFLALDLATLKGALAHGHPIILGIPCFEPAWRALTGTHDLLPEPSATQAAQAIGHAVLLVGYEDSVALPGGGSFLFRNAWGTTWASQGYARLSYAHVLGRGETPYFLEALAAPFQAIYALTSPRTRPLPR